MVTSPKIIFIVVGSLAAIVILGMIGMFCLILMKTDAALIGIIAGPTLTALGSLISLLNNTRTNAAPPTPPPLTLPEPVPGPEQSPVPVLVANPPSEPVNVTEQPKPEKLN